MLREALLEQWSLLRQLWEEPVLRVPATVVWVAELGGSLQAPVVSFLYLSMGLTPRQMGTLSAITSAGTMVLAPVYGWFVDRGDAYTAITTSAFLCAWGCLARGAASNHAWLLAAAVLQGLGGSNLPTLVLAHLASCTEASTRSLVVSGYAAQLALLQIGGKALYGPFDSLLQLMGFASQQLRYRITISVCMANCFFGVSQMLLYRRALAGGRALMRQRVPTTAKSCDSVNAAPSMQDGALTCRPPPQGTAAEAAKRRATWRASMLLTMLALWFDAAALVLVQTLWPLFLREHYGWGARGYSRLLFASSLLNTVALAIYPALERRVGRATAALALAAFAAAGAAALLPPLQTASPAAQMTHVVLMLTHICAISMLGVALKSLCSLFLAQRYQGRSFGMMSTVIGLGNIAAGLVGASLYELSTAPSRGVPRLLRGGALPFVACSGLMLLVTAFLAVAVSRFVAMRDEDRARSDTSASSDEADAKSRDGAERLFGVSLMSVV